MELTKQQISFIKQDIQNQGLIMPDVVESLVDHICCLIEQDDETDFEKAFLKAIARFGNDGIVKTEKEIAEILISKTIIMKKTMFLLGYAAAALTTTGVLFKLQHWPSASILLTLGIAVLNFGSLPIFFYDKYRSSISTK